MLGEEYRKESDGRTYLLLQKTKETFEEKMIQTAKPTGVLPMVRAELADSYKYEITGKKNLAMTFERIPMNAEQVEKVLQGILDILERGKEYLLSEDNFILLPEHIYLRLPEYEVELCYYPEYKVPLTEQIGKLFEMLLNRVDYREEKAIAMVYALYMQLQEPDMTLERMKEKLCEQVKLSEHTGLGPKEVMEEKVESGRLYFEKAEKSEPKKESFLGRFRKEFITKKNLRTEQNATPVMPAMVPCVREEAAEWGTQYTRVLSVKKTETQPALISQRDGKTIYLTKFPFYVGSLSGYMDYVIERDTVSRFHAKIIKQEEGFYLTDLNSTNGTKVNGEVLEVKEQRKLQNGDRILFADAEYVFFVKEN